MKFNKLQQFRVHNNCMLAYAFETEKEQFKEIKVWSNETPTFGSFTMPNSNTNSQ